MIHGRELGQETLALFVAAEAIDHPGRHVVNGKEGRGGGAACRQFFENNRGIEPAHLRAADIGLHIDRGEAQRRGLAQHVDWEMLGCIPFRRMGARRSAAKRRAASSIAR